MCLCPSRFRDTEHTKLFTESLKVPGYEDQSTSKTMRDFLKDFMCALCRLKPIMLVKRTEQQDRDAHLDDNLHTNSPEIKILL